MNTLNICDYANFRCFRIPVHLPSVTYVVKEFVPSPNIQHNGFLTDYLFVNYFQTWQVQKISRNKLKVKDAKINTLLKTNTLKSCTIGIYEFLNAHHLYIELSNNFR